MGKNRIGKVHSSHNRRSATSAPLPSILTITKPPSGLKDLMTAVVMATAPAQLAANLARGQRPDAVSAG
jgi:hypothetical protein